MLSRLKGIETKHLDFFVKFFGTCSDMLSRLKGIETLFQGECVLPLVCSDMLSRLKGIETLYLKSFKFDMLVQICFPV